VEKYRNVEVGEETGNSGTLAGISGNPCNTACITTVAVHGVSHTKASPEITQRVVWDAYFGLSGTLQNAMLAVAQRTTFPTWTLRLMRRPSDGLCGRYTPPDNNFIWNRILIHVFYFVKPPASGLAPDVAHTRRACC
jgi:hypothetical protein